MIVGEIEGESLFPGFMSLEFWSGVFYMIILFIFTGICFSIISFFFPASRKNWKSTFHKPISVGVLASGLFMTAMVIIGYFMV